MSARSPINPPASQIGRVNAVYTAPACSYHIPEFEGSLSIKTVSAGSAVWRVSGRRFVVNENCWLVLNDRQHYTLNIASRERTTTFCLFFERGFVEDIWRVLVRPATDLLNDVNMSPASVGFFEALQPAESWVLAKVRRFQRTLASEALAPDEWEDRFVAIGAALVSAQRDVLAAAAKLPATKASTRLELCRRVLRGRDLLLSCTNELLPLKRLAREACLSPFHFHRTFSQLFGRTPHEFLRDYRLGRAAEMLRRTRKRVTDVCVENGFESLPSFSLLFRKHFGVSPAKFRRINGVKSEIRKIG
jgi:AraC-like DNA-binding protein